MKHYYITTEPPMILSDEEPVNGFYYDTIINQVRNTNGAEYAINTITKQIIAGLPNQLEIDRSDLSDKECKKIGWVDVDKLFHSLIQNKYPFPNYNDIGYWKDVFKHGFKTAQSLNDKKWSDDDMKSAMLKTFVFVVQNGYESQLKSFIEEYITSLNQPKVFEIKAIVQDNKVKILKVL